MALPLSVSTQDQVFAAGVRNVLANGGTWADVVALTAASGTASNTISGVATVVSGVDGTGSNAASKADVDARLVTINTNLKSLASKVNELIVLINRVNA
jgi:hypothetical protein